MAGRKPVAKKRRTAPPLRNGKKRAQPVFTGRKHLKVRNEKTLLTPKQQSFVNEYLIDLNGSQAAVRAGYNVHSSQLLLAHKGIIKAIKEALEERAKRTGIDAEWLLQQLVEMYNADIRDIMYSNGALKQISQWPPIWRKMVSAIEIEERYEMVGKRRQLCGYAKRIRHIDKLKALELIGRHVNISAFEERIRSDETRTIKLIVEYETPKLEEQEPVQVQIEA